MQNNLWRKANIKLIPTFILVLITAGVSSAHGNVRSGNFEHRIIGLFWVSLFILSSLLFLNILTSTIRQSIIEHRLGVGRAAAIQFILRLFGYLIIIFTSLDNLGVPVSRVILGSAVLGIILGVAAQQSLANFFASIVLIISHPFAVGDYVSLTSGALGGNYRGKVIDIGLTHTHIREDDGVKVALPNSNVLIASSIRVYKKNKPPKISIIKNNLKHK